MTAAHLVKASHFEAPVDLALGQAQMKQLPTADYSVLPTRQVRDHLINARSVPLPT